MNIYAYEARFSEKIKSIATDEDPAHDFLHFKRVVTTAKLLCVEEQAKIEVVLPAAWLHDLVLIPKNDPRRKEASKLSADAAISYLQQLEYPSQYFDDIAHAIMAHSFSAGIEPRTIEAKIVQDADRLDGLGAVGIARCFATAGVMQRSFYCEEDPFCIRRPPDDTKYTLDHFYQKLFKTAEMMQTKSGRTEAQKRVQQMRKFLADLSGEIH